MKQPELGIRLADLRQQKNLTQEELVDACNVSVRTIQRIESGDVTPRISTVRILLSALGEDFEIFKEEVKITKPKRYLSSLESWLTVAWISGIIYFIVGFIDAAYDFARYENLGFETIQLDSSPQFYIPIKIIYFISYVFFFYGFIRLSDYFDNYLLKITCYIMIGLFALSTSLDIASLYIKISEGNLIMFGVGESISVGAVGIILGIGFMRLQDGMGVLARAAGITEIIAGACFVLVILFFLGFVVLVPAIILEIILLFKGYEFIKAERLKA
ncbi:helix-turn-helix domain-containing protein [Ekhidna sp.]